MVSAIDRRSDDQNEHRQQDHEQTPGRPEGKRSDKQRDAGVAARQGIALDALKPVEKILDMPCDKEPLEIKRMEMIDRKPRPESREEEITNIGKVETEENQEKGLLKLFPSPPEKEGAPEEHREKVVGRISDLQKIGQGRMQEGFVKYRWVAPEEEIFGFDEKVIDIPGIDDGDKLAEAVKDPEDADNRKDDPSEGIECPVFWKEIPFLSQKKLGKEEQNIEERQVGSVSMSPAE